MEVKVDLKLSESAIKELKRTKEENNMEETNLRVQVVAGGCSGFQYQLNFIGDDEINPEVDVVEDQGGINVVVDKKSLLHLDGTTINWIEDLNKRGFVFENPNATKLVAVIKASLVKEDI